MCHLVEVMSAFPSCCICC